MSKLMQNIRLWLSTLHKQPRQTEINAIETPKEITKIINNEPQSLSDQFVHSQLSDKEGGGNTISKDYITELQEAAPTTSFGLLRDLIYSVLPNYSYAPKKEAIDMKTSEKSMEQSKMSRAGRISIAKRLSEQRLLSAKRACTLLQKLKNNENSRRLHLEQLINHLLQYPLSKSSVVDAGAEQLLLQLSLQYKSQEEENLCRVALSLIGSVRPPKGWGIRVLSIDGGGTRGIMSLEILAELERMLNGRRLHECFDLMVGVSTGAIMASLLGSYQMPVEQVKKIYLDISQKLFSRARLSGISTLVWSHSYYDTAFWVGMLKSTVGKQLMMDLVQKHDGPKLCIVSCIVNTAKLQPFMFRNYALPTHGRQSFYAGSCKYAIWQALQASAAAPGYFEEVWLDGLLHQDGGVLQNNPTALAIHEAKALWPYENIQCVLSIGNGRTTPDTPAIDGTLMHEHLGDLLNTRSKTTTLREKIVKIVDSATDTELVHTNLASLLDNDVYYRLNPHMSHTYTLDEISPERLDTMRRDASMYIRRNTPKLRYLAEQLNKKRRPTQNAYDQLNETLMRKFNLRLQ